MFKLGWDVGVDTVEQVLQLLFGVGRRDIGQHLHLLLELVLEEPVVNAHNLGDVDATDVILLHILGRKPGGH